MDLGICKRCGEFEGKCECGKGEVLIKSEDRKKVSKFLSGLLRHFARDFGITLNEEGWAELNDVLKVLKERYGVGRKQIELIVKFDPKKRFEIKNGRIRARYGHSIEVKTDWSEEGEIPKKLYHATSHKNLSSILKLGLLPMKRLEVHMCSSPREAIEVGKRHSSNPVLLEIDAEGLMKRGIKVRKKGKVYTADFVPPEFLRVVEKSSFDRNSPNPAKGY
ncbi:MAG: RNA 2'-phosphotransferase [Archaeoglobus sp.]|uniref:RNA 2'-phosphotransferase n=1 Tax=Archaeoglobus sp. TaxID=1872626 RepID=UPI001E0ECCB8|nr:RNA 2'-phosphotransferase [Archaeoglobus sp.]MBO8180152.1 RNA 2'-phosphotransferase [Archaeoglobus sp.]